MLRVSFFCALLLLSFTAEAIIGFSSSSNSFRCRTILAGVEQNLVISKYDLEIDLDEDQGLAVAKALIWVSEQKSSFSPSLMTLASDAKELTDILSGDFGEDETSAITMAFLFEEVEEHDRTAVFTEFLNEKNLGRELNEAQTDAIHILFSFEDPEISRHYDDFLEAFSVSHEVIRALEELINYDPSYDASKKAEKILELINAVKYTRFGYLSDEQLKGFDLALSRRNARGISIMEQDEVEAILQFFGFDSYDAKTIVSFLSESDREWAEYIKAEADELSSDDIQDLFEWIEEELKDHGFNEDGEVDDDDGSVLGFLGL